MKCLLDILNGGSSLFNPQPMDLGKELENGAFVPPSGPDYVAPQQGRGGILGTGLDREDFMNSLLRAAAIAQGNLEAGSAFGDKIGARARAEAEAAQKRQAELQDWQWKQDYEQSHQGPTEYARSLQEQGLQPGTPEFQQAIAQYNTSRADPTVTTTLPGDRFYSGSRSGLAAALGGISGAPRTEPGVQEGQTATNPQTGEKLIFRNGAWAPVGGGSGNATGGFRP